MWQAVSRLLTSHFNKTFTLCERQELPGGAVHQAWRIGDGEHSVFVKCDTPDFLHSFQAEADQLALLAHSGTVRTPEVYGVGSARDASFLLLEYLPVRPLDAHHAYLLGQQLARLHRWSEQPQFGLDTDNLLATSPQPNAWQRRWANFLPSSVSAGSCSWRPRRGLPLAISMRLSNACAIAYRIISRSRRCCMAICGPITWDSARRGPCCLTPPAIGATANAIWRCFRTIHSCHRRFTMVTRASGPCPPTLSPASLSTSFTIG